MAGRPVAKMTLPSFVTDASVRMVNTFSVLASGHFLANIAVIARPSAVANTFIWAHTVAVSAIGANWGVTVCPLPA